LVVCRARLDVRKGVRALPQSLMCVANTRRSGVKQRVNKWLVANGSTSVSCGVFVWNLPSGANYQNLYTLQSSAPHHFYKHSGCVA
jgi:hypothetical protein